MAKRIGVDNDFSRWCFCLYRRPSERVGSGSFDAPWHVKSGHSHEIGWDCIVFMYLLPTHYFMPNPLSVETRVTVTGPIKPEGSNESLDL